MRYVRQPEGSSLCGQACVAMLAGISLEESIAIFGSRGSTTTKQVVAVLDKLGIPNAGILTRLKKGVEKTPTCLVVLHFKGENHTHWTIWHRGVFWDPAVGVFGGYNAEYVRQTSFLPVYLTGEVE